MDDYLIQGINVLLQEDRIVQRYYPLIPFKAQLLQGLLRMGCLTRSACLALTDDALIAAGLPDAPMAVLFRQFLHLYDYKGKGVRDIPDAATRPPEELAALLELMRLPGVKAIRAQLYFRCGLHSLADFATAEAEPLRAHIAHVIERDALPYSVPQPKELRTQIAVANVFTHYAVP